MKPYFVLDRQNKVQLAADFDDWMSWVRKNHDRMEVALTVYPHCHIRTMFLGVEATGEDRVPPVVFETVIIGGQYDGRAVPAAEWEQAKHNHVRISEFLARDAVCFPDFHME